jgi:uncharacterized repeat protein (TIGR02543 family)
MKKFIILTFIVLTSIFLYSCKAEDKVSVTLYLDGNQLGNVINLDTGDKIIVPCANIDGYTIDGWYTSLDSGDTFETKWVFEVDIVENDLELYAVWIPNI